MNRTRAVRVLAVPLAAIAVMFSTGMATALELGAPPAKPSPAQVDQAAARIFNGTYTRADIAVVKSNPKVAAVTPDPDAPVKVEASDPISSTTEAMTSLSAQAVTAVSVCNASKWVTYYKTSLLGSTIYGWRHVVVYCRNGVTITQWQDRYDYLTEAQGIVYFLAGTSSATGIATNVATSFRQRAIEYCVAKYGCYATVYPHSTIKVYANGTWWYSGTGG